jgi:adenine-specific DNA-methyltransferase
VAKKNKYADWSKEDLIKRIEALEKRKKYGLVWDEERTKEKFESDAEGKLPVLKEVKSKEINTDPDKPTHILIEGDNYHALSVLNYTHERAVDVIYIDPPYNSGNRDFYYNDSYIDKDDAYRHSKWLSFMSKRLRLARNLLKDSGIIFISIDDNESAQMKLLCDEIFGQSNSFVSFFIQVRYEGETLVEDSDFQKLIEQVYVYGKTTKAKLNRSKTDYSFDKYMWKIVEKGNPKVLELGKKKVGIFQSDQYEIKREPPYKDNLKEIWATGKILDGNSSGRFFRDFLTDRYKEDGYGVMYKVYGIGDDQYEYRYFTGPKKKGATKGKYYQGVPKDILELTEQKEKYSPIPNFYNFADSFGNCRLEGGVDFRSGKKPIAFLKTLLELGLRKDSTNIVLDFFAGSGSTGHAMMDLNERNKTKHQFILCTNNELNGEDRLPKNEIKNEKKWEEYGICRRVTYPRLSNVISGNANNKGLGGNLKYYRTAFVPQEPTDKNKELLTKEAVEMLCLRENTFEFISETDTFKIFKNKDHYTGIIFDQLSIPKFKKAVSKFDKPVSVYVFSLGDDDFSDVFADMKKTVKVCPIPEAILRVYRRIFK